MCVAIRRTAARGPLLKASFGFERLPSKRLDTGFSPKFDASSCVARGEGLKSFGARRGLEEF